MVKRAYYHKYGRCLQSCDEQSANNCVWVIGYELMNGRDMKWKWRSTSAVQVHPPEVIVVITFPETNGGSGTILRISPVHQFMESWAATRYVSAEEHCTKQLTGSPHQHTLQYTKLRPNRESTSDVSRAVCSLGTWRHQSRWRRQDHTTNIGYSSSLE